MDADFDHRREPSARRGWSGSEASESDGSSPTAIEREYVAAGAPVHEQHVSDRNRPGFMPRGGGRDPRGAYTGFYRTPDAPKMVHASTVPFGLAPSPYASSPPIDAAPRSRRGRWFRPASFVAFALLLLALLVGLIVVYHFANSEDGFTILGSTSPYAWKYGPTAILVIVIALWRQFDYQLKVHAPWVQMQDHANIASKTVLLDYLSPIWPIAFFKSLRNRHWRVSLGLLVLLLLQICVLLSTALLIAQNTPIVQPGVVMTLDNRVNTSLKALDADSLVVAYYGMVTRGLDPPIRTTFNAAYQNVDMPPDLPVGGVVTANVLGFYPSMDCEPAHQTFGMQSNNLTGDGDNPNATTTVFTFQSDNCVTTPTVLIPVDFCSADPSDCPPQQLVGTTAVVNCTDDSGNSDGTSALVLVLLEVDNLGGGQQQFGNYTAMTCLANYSIDPAMLILNSAQRGSAGYAQLSAPLEVKGQQLPSLTPALLLADVTSMVATADTQVPGRNASTTMGNPNSTTAIDGYFNFMMLAGSITDPNDFFNATLMSDLGVRVFKGLAAQWVGAAVPLSSDTKTTGSYSWTIFRLHVAPSAFVGMCVLLAIGALAAMILAAFHRQFSGRPDDITFQIAVLRRSEAFCLLLQGLGHASGKQLKATLNARFSMVQGEQICVHDNQGEEPRIAALPPAPAQSRFWRPLAARYPLAILTLTVLLTLIVILEILQRQSDANSGLADVLISQTRAQQVSSYLAAAVMLALAACSRSAEFDFAVFGPYHAMKRGLPISKARSSVLGSLPPVALYQATGRRQFGVASAMVLAVLGSTLTIVVSGLYTIDAVPHLYPTTAMAVDHFNLSWDGSQTLTGGTAFILIEHHNASYPEGTYNEIAYNTLELSLDGQTLAQALGSSQVEIDTPVLRPSLNCSVVPKSAITVDVTDQLDDEDVTERPEQGSYANVTVVMELPAQCKASNPNYDSSTQLVVLTAPDMSVPSTGSVFDGQMNLPWVQGGANDSDGSSVPQTLTGADCPTLSFQFGQYTVGQTGSEDTTVLVCSQYQESLLATLTLDLPDMSLNVSVPPILQEHTAQTVSKTQYDFSVMFSNRLEYAPDDDDNIDSFINVLLYGTEGIPGEELIGPANAQRFQDAVQHVYRKYMVQVLGDAARVPGAANPPGIGNVRRAAPADNLQARVNAPRGLRVVQQNTAKIVLQAVLGAMVVCLLLSYFTMRDIRHLLYHNPCTVAGHMSLLAGSPCLDELALVGTRENGSAAEQEKLLTGRHPRRRRVRLGWWAAGHEQSRYSIKVE